MWIKQKFSKCIVVQHLLCKYCAAFIMLLWCKINLNIYCTAYLFIFYVP